MRIIGIDPGKTGAAAVIKFGHLTEVVPFKGELDRCRKVNHLCDNYPFVPTHYYIERVTASPQMGVVSAFTFGKYSEAVELSALSTGMEVHMVRPQKWQGSIMSCYSKGDKGVLFEFAKKVFPEEHKMKMFNKSSADAVLIAYYGYLAETTREEK